MQLSGCDRSTASIKRTDTNIHTSLSVINLLLQLIESITQLKTERDCYVEQIQEEGRVWKDKTEQLLTQVNTHQHKPCFTKAMMMVVFK